MKISRSQKVKMEMFGENTLESLYPKNINLLNHKNINKKFGKLTILYAIENSSSTLYWMCQCACGEYFIASNNFLSTEAVPNCGCLSRQLKERKKRAKSSFVFEDGILILDDLNKNKNSNIKQEDAFSLKKEELKGSKGEQKIQKILLKNNIPFIREHQVILPDGSQGRFDFYVNNSYYIEYDDIQHTEVVQRWGGIEGLEKRQEKDELKNEYCMIERIPLIRVPYTENEITMEMLSLATSKYIFYDGSEVNSGDIFYLCHSNG